MTEAEGAGQPDFSAVLEEQKAVLTAMNEKIKALETRNANLEAKITALSGAAAKPAEKPAAAAAPEKSEQEKAYERVLADLGLKKAGDL